MSLVTLKRKTAAKYKNMSVGHANFSLNGTLRNQGYVGRNLISEPCMMCVNDPNVIKNSVGGSSNHVQAKHFHSTRNGVDTVKPDSNHIQNSQHTYIEQERKKAIAACANTEKNAPAKVILPCNKSVNIVGTGGLPIFGANALSASNTVSCSTTKDLSGTSKSSGSYIFKLANDCAENEKKPTNPTGGSPLPGTF
jgi:hypothetical protein